MYGLTFANGDCDAEAAIGNAELGTDEKFTGDGQYYTTGNGTRHIDWKALKTVVRVANRRCPQARRKDHTVARNCRGFTSACCYLWWAQSWVRCWGRLLCLPLSLFVSLSLLSVVLRDCDGPFVMTAACVGANGAACGCCAPAGAKKGAHPATHEEAVNSVAPATQP